MMCRFVISLLINRSIVNKRREKLSTIIIVYEDACLENFVIKE
jgi:hypothetical protein